MVLARLICFIPSESNQHLTSAELEHGIDLPKSHIPIRLHAPLAHHQA